MALRSGTGREDKLINRDIIKSLALELFGLIGLKGDFHEYNNINII